MVLMRKKEAKSVKIEKSMEEGVERQEAEREWRKKKVDEEVRQKQEEERRAAEEARRRKEEEDKAAAELVRRWNEEEERRKAEEGRREEKRQAKEQQVRGRMEKRLKAWHSTIEVGMKVTGEINKKQTMGVEEMLRWEQEQEQVWKQLQQLHMEAGAKEEAERQEEEERRVLREKTLTHHSCETTKSLGDRIELLSRMTLVDGPAPRIYQQNLPVTPRFYI